MKTTKENAQKWGTIFEKATDLEAVVDESALAFFAPPYDVRLQVGALGIGLVVRKSLAITSIPAMVRIQRENAADCPEIDAWVLAVPRMTGALAGLAAGMKVNWIDEDGNADIRAEGLRIKIRGECGTGKARDQRVALSYVARRVGRALMASDRFPVKQLDLAAAIKAHNTQVSRAWRELEKFKVITPGLRGIPPALNRARLLELLRDDTDTDAPTWMEGNLIGPCDKDLAKELARRLETRPGATYALTGRAAALRHASEPADDEPVLVYVMLNCPGPKQLGFEVDEGGPVRICATEDVSRLLGATRIGGAMCASAAMTYLDLKPEELQENFAERVKLLAVDQDKQNQLIHQGDPK